MNPSATIQDPPPPPARAEGFFWCGHCNHVIDLDPECEVTQTYKCPRCRKWTVKWKFPMKPRVKPEPVPISPASARASELFSNLKNAVA